MFHRPVAGITLLFLLSPFALGQPPAEGLRPDLRTVVPLHLQIVNSHQREILRFSNGIANTGAGNLQMRPLFPVTDQPTMPALQATCSPDSCPRTPRVSCTPIV